jgi:DNA-binding NtrC family response regulator
VSRPHESTLSRTQFGELVGRAPAMRALFEDCAKLASTLTAVVVTGEAGTGKHTLARALHAESARRGEPFVVFDCARSDVASLESALFGRAEGATRGWPGALELAQRGTLLLDEVADLPPPLQARLSAALCTATFTRASAEPATAQACLPLDVRLITASRRKLGAARDRGHLLDALYRALAGAELVLPPLRERRDDVPLLAQTLLARLPEGAGNLLSPEALSVLALHDWPGNVRELRNLVERFAYALRSGQPAARRLSAMLLSGELAPGPGLDASLARFDRRTGGAVESPGFEPDLPYRDERARFEAAFEQRYVSWLLERHDGNVSAAARAADMDRKYLHRLAKKHGR